MHPNEHEQRLLDQQSGAAMDRRAEMTFTPNEKAREAFRRMNNEARDAMMAQFFDIWEAEGDPRRAGSMAAHAYIRNAARMAVFGAQCGGHKPDAELWATCCKDAFDAALSDVAEAFDTAETAESLNQQHTQSVKP